MGRWVKLFLRKTLSQLHIVVGVTKVLHPQTVAMPKDCMVAKPRPKHCTDPAATFLGLEGSKQFFRALVHAHAQFDLLAGALSNQGANPRIFFTVRSTAGHRSHMRRQEYALRSVFQPRARIGAGACTV